MTALPPSFALRAVQPEDAERLYSLKRVCFPDAYLDLSVFRSPKSARFLAALATPVLAPRHPMLVTGDFDGYLQTVIRDGKIHLSFIGVHPNAAGRGLGRHLLRAFEEVGRSKGCHRATLDVFESNPHALDWYLRHGYEASSQSETVLVSLKGLEARNAGTAYSHRLESEAEEEIRGFSMVSAKGGEVGIIAGDTVRPRLGLSPLDSARAMRADFPERTRMILSGALRSLDLDGLTVLNREIGRRLEIAL